jgi:hypothetical protein
MYNPNWNRWLRASVIKHFATELAIFNPHVEGVKRTDMCKDDFCEIRMDGPYFAEISKNVYDVTVEVNILIQTAMTRSKNLYTHEIIGGAVCAAFVTIPVFKLGQESGDDGTQIGCLQRMDQPQRPIKVNDFGQIEAATLLRQATVEGHYNIKLP